VAAIPALFTHVLQRERTMVLLNAGSGLCFGLRLCPPCPEYKIRRMGVTRRRTVGRAFGGQLGPKARSIYGWAGYGETWNSESCAAGQPVLAVKTSLTFRAVVPAGRLKLTVLPVAGLKVYPAEGTTVVYVAPSVET
jgi:hypothetical protein